MSKKKWTAQENYWAVEPCKKTLRQEHELKVPQDLLYFVMQDVDPEGLQSRGGVGNPKQKNAPLKAQILFILLTDTTN